MEWYLGFGIEVDCSGPGGLVAVSEDGMWAVVAGARVDV